jgi:hypothetical protein
LTKRAGEQRHGVGHGARGFAPAVPADQHVLAERAHVARVRHDDRGAPAAHHHILDEITRDIGQTIVRIDLAEDQQIGVARMQDRGFGRVAGRRLPFDAAPGAFGGRQKALLGFLAALLAQALVDGQLQRLVGPPQRLEQILADDVEPNQMRVPASREFEREVDARRAARAIVEMDEQGLVAHDGSFSVDAVAVSAGWFDMQPAGIIRTGVFAWRSTRSATLPSTSRRKPRRPCVPSTIRSAPISPATVTIRCGISSPSGATFEICGVPAVARLHAPRCVVGDAQSFFTERVDQDRRIVAVGVVRGHQEIDDVDRRQPRTRLRREIQGGVERAGRRVAAVERNQDVRVHGVFLERRSMQSSSAHARRSR